MGILITVAAGPRRDVPGDRDGAETRRRAVWRLHGGQPDDRWFDRSGQKGAARPFARGRAARRFACRGYHCGLEYWGGARSGVGQRPTSMAPARLPTARRGIPRQAGRPHERGEQGFAGSGAVITGYVNQTPWLESARTTHLQALAHRQDISLGVLEPRGFRAAPGQNAVLHG